ncbi:DNA-directed RNA polymerase I subunit rpa49 [Puccinia graminis f. sp. tritici]|uniref:DNA-directed RNA polymerase I subunit rpa49 n=1 Tax=Puccinia graminis f. sp. tritici TaxID=56615 RepID=A0A5B0QGN4_PUCGR|nr:DNA-directed RNA polymerase I subunit rpa49 [Puccinia graminis f. sp. tritici]
MSSKTVTVALAMEKAKGNYVGPALVSFPDVQPDPSTTQFQLYSHRSNEKSPALLLGQTNELEFRSENQADQSNCSYMLGLHVASAGRLTLFPTQLYQLRPVVKRLRDVDDNRLTEQATDNYEARRTLGTTFGTKKARRALQAAARNKVDPETMTHLEGQISAAIAENSSCLPSATVQAQEVDANRPIPPYNINAANPKDVYLLSDVVTNLELNSIPMGPILNARTAEDAARCLPTSHSQFVNSRLKALWKRCPDGKLDKKETKRLRILIYISYLIAIRRLHKFSRDSISNKLAIDQDSTTPDSIIDGILNRFTEPVKTSDGSLKHNLTSFSKIKLYSYIAVLCLIHDEYMTRVSGLSDDLQEPTKSINDIFLNLGCKMSKLTVPEFEALEEGPASKDAKEFNAQRTIAKLVVPLVFPPPKIRKRKNKAV